MAFKQIKNGIKNGVYNYCLFICDSDSDISSLPKEPDVSAGSEAIVIDGRKKYMLNNSGEWKVMVNYASSGSSATFGVEDDGDGNVYIV